MFMLFKIILRLSVLTLCFTALSTYAADWFRVDKIPSALTTWLLDLIKDNPGKIITIIGFFYLARKFGYKIR